MIEKPIKVGNADLTVLKIGHGRKHWEKYKDIVIREIIRNDEIIMEYDPREHKIESWPFWLLNGQIELLNSTDNYLFIQTGEVCEQLKKNVHVFDPAYNESFIGLHTLLFAASILPPGAVAVEMIRELYKQRNTPVTRKAFIKWGFATTSAVTMLGKGAIAAACTATATLLGTGAVVGPNRVAGLSPALGNLQNEFREVVTSQHTVDFGASLPERRKTLMITTEEHGNGTIYNIKNADHRRQILERYLWLGNFAYFKPLFLARHYPQGIVPAIGPTEKTLLSSLTS